ncbi:MAG: hypothetical protein EOO17_02605 [Chloroflexi bacterium]|nr:MAG: hypothetical protein EOO17_02605 [Chloroflexota bacterium]
MPRSETTLRNDPIWKDANAVAEHIFEHTLKTLDDTDDETWNFASQLRSGAVDMIFEIGRAVGSDTQSPAEFEWNSARKNLAGLQAVYLFAGKRRLLVIDPSFVVQVDKLLKDLSAKITDSKTTQKQLTKQELKPWVEKYNLWKEMNA